MRGSGGERRDSSGLLNLDDEAEIAAWSRSLKRWVEPLRTGALLALLDAAMRDLLPYARQADTDAGEAEMQENAAAGAAIALRIVGLMNETEGGRGIRLQAQVWVLVVLLAAVQGAIQEAIASTEAQGAEL